MNDAQIKGEGTDIGGKVKETVGNVTGDGALQSEGLSDQLTGKVQKAVGSATDAINQGVGPLTDKARAFAKQRPWATAALAGVLGVALINTLRGKK